METNNDVLSRTVSFLRFPLIVAVVFIHTGLGKVRMDGQTLISHGMFPVFDFVDGLVANEFARIAVPLFFFISGYFFFSRPGFSWEAYGRKLKKRTSTLLVPYVFWNLLMVGLSFLGQTFLSSMTSGDHKLIADFTWLDWLNVFWDHRGDNMPANYPFWFIRDLMTLCVLSPLVYGFIRYTRRWGVALLGILYVAGLLPKLWLYSADPYFFFWGAWFALNGKDFTDSFQPCLRLALAGYILLVVASRLSAYQLLPDDAGWGDAAHRLGVIAGLVLSVSAVAHGIAAGKLKASPLLQGSTFFIYAYHAAAIMFLCKLWVKLCRPSTDAEVTAAFFALPVIVVCLGIGLHALCQRCCPRLLSVVTGNR